MIVRSLVLTLVAIVLAGPQWRQEHQQVTVIGLIDISGSVQRFVDLSALQSEQDGSDAAIEARSTLDHVRQWFRTAFAARDSDDRIGLIVFDGRAAAIAAPTRGDYPDDQIDLAFLDGTNIAEAIQLGIAMFPMDTARRLVLVSDGNETLGSAVDAAAEAAGVQIDVLPLAYRIDRDVQVVRIDAPASSRPDQVVTVRMVLRSTIDTRGSLSLLRDGVAVDLTPGEAGSSLNVRVPEGESTFSAQVQLGSEPVQRFAAVFTPADMSMDALVENNRAEAITTTPSRGQVLYIVAEQSDARTPPLQAVLEAAGIPVELRTAARMPRDIISLASFDLVILDNVGAYQLDEQTQEMLARTVEDMGVGLIMVGGESSFGAGGWNGTAVEAVLPVELDLPREMRIAQAALVLVLDKSGSMGQQVAGSRSTQQEIANRGSAAAIESLQPESLVGVVTFDSFSHTLIPIGPNQNSGQSAQRVLGIVPGGGTHLPPALERAHEMLLSVDVAKKYVVCLSDGRSDGRARVEAIVSAMAADGISVSTIAVGDQADSELLAKMAEIGSGEFHQVLNPEQLPRVLVDSVQVVNKPLIKEVEFQPVRQPTGSTLTSGMNQAPPLRAIVLTAPRSDPSVINELLTPDGEPLLAIGQAGLGRTAAFTSDAGHAWADRWLEWPGYGPFWTQLVRMIARQPMNQDFELLISRENDGSGRLRLTLEASDSENESAGASEYLTVLGTVYSPSGEMREVRLRQNGPGQYEAVVEAGEEGAYLAVVSPRRGQQALPPLLGSITQPPGAEYRQFRSNVSLLQEIAGLTGGRRLELATPQSANLFDRSGLAPSISLLPAWPFLLMVLCSMLLVDVASRRLAWDSVVLARLYRRALNRAWPGRSVGARSRGTLESLRQRSEDVDTSIRRDADRFKPLEGSGPRYVARKQHEPERKEQEQTVAEDPAVIAARKARVEEALDAISGSRTLQQQHRPSEVPQAPAREDSSDQSQSRSEPENGSDDASETTRSLLESRRRRQKRSE